MSGISSSLDQYPYPIGLPARAVANRILLLPPKKGFRQLAVATSTAALLEL